MLQAHLNTQNVLEKIQSTVCTLWSPFNDATQYISPCIHLYCCFWSWLCSPVFCIVCFFWVVFSFCSVCNNLSSVLYFPACTNV